jgi:uncharacterized protein YcbK (DUF882 family)
MSALLVLVIASAQVATAHAPKVQARILQPKRVQQASPARRVYPAVDLYAVNLDESLRWRPVDDKGHPRKGADTELTRFLRCWHTGKQHKVDARLGKVLYQVARHYPGHRVEIYSGFRPRKYCTREHSRHLTASAIDFRIDGVKNEALIGWLRATFHPAGVGYYPNGVHVHLDVDRGHDTYWIDPGDAPSHDERPIAQVGDTAPADVEATGDEAANVLPRLEPADPPSVDPALD